MNPEYQENIRAGCEFCVDHGDNSAFTRLHGGEQEVWSAGSMRLLIDTYPITEGHVLLIPKEHFFSSSQAPSGVVHYEMGHAVADLTASYPQTPIIYFEHGSGSQGDAHVVACGESCGPSNDHAHIHIMPSVKPETGEKVDISYDQIASNVRELLRLCKWDDVFDSEYHTKGETMLSSRPQTEKPYLHFGIRNIDGTYEEETFVQPDLGYKIPSQLLRRTIAPLLYGRAVTEHAWDYHQLEWRIFVDGFKDDVPHLNAMINRFRTRMVK